MTVYSDTLKYLYGLEKRGIIFGLENIEWILKNIGNPHHSLTAIHVGGTNGKGSVTSMIASVLKNAGFKTGKYISPHLASFTERIAIDDNPIKENEVVNLTISIRDRLEQSPEQRKFSFFDFTTALCLEYFKQNTIDIAVMEVGLGGRLDSTNIIRPVISVITNIDYDHMDHLGNTIEDIAHEKSGIIKKGIPVVTGADGVPWKIITDRAVSCSSPLYTLGRDFSIKQKGENNLAYSGITRHFANIHVGLQGHHQLENTGISLCVLELMQAMGFIIPDKAIYDGLKSVMLPGRIEIIDKGPMILMDGAHNPHGMRALKRFILDRYKNMKKILVFGVMKDKQYDKMLPELASFADRVILTRPSTGNGRGLSPEDMLRYTRDPVLTGSVKEALLYAKDMSAPGDLIIVTGSLFIVGEARTCIDEIF